MTSARDDLAAKLWPYTTLAPHGEASALLEILDRLVLLESKVEELAAAVSRLTGGHDE